MPEASTCYACAPCCAVPLYWRKTPEGAFVYDPPQLKPTSPWWWIRACDLATYPCGVCCATLCLSRDVVWNTSQLQAAMQQTSPSRAPPVYSGFWFMQDNTMPESVVSLDDAEWRERVVVKNARHTWSREPTLCGILFHVASSCCGTQTIKRRKDSSWKPQDGYIYQLRNSDRLVDASGRSVPTKPGDRMRVFYCDGEASPVYFMYILRKVSGHGVAGDAVHQVNQCGFASVWPMLLSRAPGS